MKLSHALVAAVAVGAVLSAAPLRAQEAPPGSPKGGDVANGKKIFLAVGCFECHGRVGQGGAFNGPAPRLAQTQLPFEGFEMQLRNPANDMPAYSEQVMPEKDVADIYAYVKSLPGPSKAIPAMLND
jgi:mono/diheme cytochrome c family protein